MYRNVTKEIVLRSIGDCIYDAIIQNGYSSIYQFWLHKLAGIISRQTLHKIISGKVDPKFTTLLIIANNLNISVSELLNKNKLEVILYEY